MFRLDVYLGERDSFGVGFSDNVVFRKQYYLQLLADDGDVPALYLPTSEEHLADTREELENAVRGRASGGTRAGGPGPDSEWRFPVRGTGFEATLAVTFTQEPEPAEDQEGQRDVSR